MQRRPLAQWLRKLSLLLSLPVCFSFAVHAVPQIQPFLYTPMKVLALTSALGTQPQQSAVLVREHYLSQNNENSREQAATESFSQGVILPSAPVVEERPLLPEENSSPQETAAASNIPVKYQAPIIEEQMSGKAKAGFPIYENILIKNTSGLYDDEVIAIADEAHELKLSNSGPQVLLYHTHATESYETYDGSIYDTRGTWRSTDPDDNMIAVGNAIAAAIEKHGIKVIHDVTLHDYPSYNGSYERSAETIKRYQEQYPTLSVFLDIHRDAIQRDDTLVKPVTTIDSKKVAQLMIIAGSDCEGKLGIPNWKDNFRFGAKLQSQIESLYPGLCRPLYLAERKYNQDLSNASLLLEVGSHGNTLEEALLCGEMTGNAIGLYLATLMNP